MERNPASVLVAIVLTIIGYLLVRWLLSMAGVVEPLLTLLAALGALFVLAGIWSYRRGPAI